MTQSILSYSPTERQTMKGTCCNCGGQMGRGAARGRCKRCYDYWRVHSRERLLGYRRPKDAPTWREVSPVEARRCDCGKTAIWLLTVTINETGHVTLKLCDACAALERSLFPVDSWAGD